MQALDPDLFAQIGTYEVDSLLQTLTVATAVGRSHRPHSSVAPAHDVVFIEKQFRTDDFRLTQQPLAGGGLQRPACSIIVSSSSFTAVSSPCKCGTCIPCSFRSLNTSVESCSVKREFIQIRPAATLVHRHRFAPGLWYNYLIKPVRMKAINHESNQKSQAVRTEHDLQIFRLRSDLP